MTETNFENHFDIAVIGAGAAGLTAAACLGMENLRIICLDSRFGFEGEKNGDTRTIALLQNSVYLLENIGVWRNCKDSAQALQIMKVVDDTGRFPPVPDACFDAAELGPDPFGYNIPNDRLVSALADHARTMTNITLHATSGVRSLSTRTSDVTITTRENQTFTAGLVVGADGPDSIARRAAGISTHDWAYDQTAVACWFSHSLPHNDTSTEFHRKSGPLVVVPMQGNRCGLVWVEAPDEAARLTALGEDEFAFELETAIHGSLGTVTQVSRRSAFPLAGLTANRFAESRTVLVGHAAHVLPPIGAQGLNLGLRDAAMLADIISTAFRNEKDIGGPDVMKEYDRARRGDVMSRTFTVDMLNRSLLFGWFPPFQAMRGFGVQLLNNIGPLRRAVMRQGIGPQETLPPLMYPHHAKN